MAAPKKTYSTGEARALSGDDFMKMVDVSEFEIKIEEYDLSDSEVGIIGLFHFHYDFVS